jgi:hypothetical protein
MLTTFSGTVGGQLRQVSLYYKKCDSSQAKKPFILYYLYHILTHFFKSLTGSYIMWMLFSLHEPCSQFCKYGLIMVNWSKHVVKIKIKIYCCVWPKPENILLPFSLINTTGCPIPEKLIFEDLFCHKHAESAHQYETLHWFITQSHIIYLRSFPTSTLTTESEWVSRRLVSTELLGFPVSTSECWRWFPSFQVASTCLSCSPPDLNFLVTFFPYLFTCKITTATGW